MAEKSEICTTAEVLLNLGITSSVSDADRALIGMTKRQVENRIRQFCRWDITQATYTHFLPATDDYGYAIQEGYLEVSGGKAYWENDRIAGDVLQLPQMYVSSITSIYEDRSAAGGQGGSDFAASTLLTSGTDYYLDMDDSTFSIAGHVIRKVGSWSRRKRTIKVTYVAGFTATQLDEQYQDIKQACILETRNWYKRAKSGQGSDSGGVGEIKQESIGGEYTVQYVTSESEKMGSLSGHTMDLLKPYKRWSLDA